MSENGKVTLAAKLAKARSAVQGIEKKGRNQKQGYDYVRAEDVVREAERVLGEQGVLVLPGISAITEERVKTAKGGEALLIRVDLDYEVIDSASGEAISKPWVGYGYDAPGDKAIYKAITGAGKYFLAALLGISFGDDPEDGGGEEVHRPITTRNNASATTPCSQKQKAAILKLLKDSDLSEEAQKAVWVWAHTAVDDNGERTLGRPAVQTIFEARDEPNGLQTLARKAGFSDLPPPDDVPEAVPDETVEGDEERVPF